MRGTFPPQRGQKTKPIMERPFQKQGCRTLHLFTGFNAAWREGGKQGEEHTEKRGEEEKRGGMSVN